MTPEQIALVASTRAAVDGPALAVAFYDALFSARPDLRQRFPDDMGQQRHKFLLSLDEIVRSISELDVFEARVLALGADHHHRYGVRPDEYPPVREALLTALSSTLDEGLTPDAEDAWRSAFDLVAETMMDGGAAASQARSDGG